MASRTGTTTAESYEVEAPVKPRLREAALDGTVDLARDRELVERCQGGDRSAFEELYHRYHRRLFHFCLRRLHEPYEAEDASQEAFTRAWRALPNFAGERRFYPWLTVIAANVCTDVLRRRSRQTPVEDLPMAAVDLESADLDESLIKQVDATIARRALEKLSDRHRRVLQLREGSGWSTQRIAEHEGVAVPAMETLLWRARQALKREFAAIAESGGRMGILLGLGFASLRRLVGRAGSRVAARLPLLQAASVRSPVAVGSSLLLAGGVVVGGVAYVASTATGPAKVQLPPVSAGPPSGATSIILPAAAGPTPGSSGATGAGSATAPGQGSSGATPGSAAATGGGSTGAGPEAATVPGAGTVAADGNAASGGVNGLGSTASSNLGNLGSSASSAVNGLGSTASSAVGSLGSTASSAVGSLGSTASSVVGGVTGGAGQTLNGVLNGLGGLADTSGSAASGSSSGGSGTGGVLP